VGTEQTPNVARSIDTLTRDDISRLYNNNTKKVIPKEQATYSYKGGMESWSIQGNNIIIQRIPKEQAKGQLDKAVSSGGVDVNLARSGVS